MATRGDRLEEKERAQLRLGAAHHGDAITWDLLDAPPSGIASSAAAPPLPKKLTPRAFAQRADGAVFFVAEEGRRSVARANGKDALTVVASTAFELDDIAVLEDRFLVAGGRDGAHVVDLEAPERGAIAKLPGLGTRPRPEPALGAICGGRLLWHRPTAHKSTSIYRIEKGKPKRVATIDVPLTIVEQGGQIFGKANFAWIRLKGLETLLPPPSTPTSTSTKKLALVPIRGAIPPSPALSDSFLKATKREARWFRIADDGRAIAFDGNKTSDISWIDRAGKPHAIKAPSLPRTLDLASDGTVLIALYDRLLFLDERGSKSPVEKKLPSKLGTIIAAFFCADDLVAVLAPKGLHLLTRGGTVKASAPITQPSFMLPFRGGKLLVVTSHAKTSLIVYEVAKGKLRARLKAPESAATFYPAGDRFVVQTHAGGVFELAGS